VGNTPFNNLPKKRKKTKNTALRGGAAERKRRRACSEEGKRDLSRWEKKTSLSTAEKRVTSHRILTARKEQEWKAR